MNGRLEGKRWLRPALGPAVLLVLLLGLISMPAASFSSPSEGSGEARSLTPAQKKAKAKALRKCRNIKAGARRKACIAKVEKKYGGAATTAKTWQVGVWDNYYSPQDLNLKLNDSINWTWKEPNGREAHDVGLLSGPSGVSPYDFLSSTTAVFGTKFKRRFKVPGNYSFICSLHYTMTMQVKVTR